jgi:hypothetical protein
MAGRWPADRAKRHRRRPDGRRTGAPGRERAGADHRRPDRGAGRGAHRGRRGRRGAGEPGRAAAPAARAGLVLAAPARHLRRLPGAAGSRRGAPAAGPDPARVHPGDPVAGHRHRARNRGAGPAGRDRPGHRAGGPGPGRVRGPGARGRPGGPALPRAGWPGPAQAPRTGRRWRPHRRAGRASAPRRPRGVALGARGEPRRGLGGRPLGDARGRISGTLRARRGSGGHGGGGHGGH